jgi:hypothetical protein
MSEVHARISIICIYLYITYESLAIQWNITILIWKSNYYAQYPFTIFISHKWIRSVVYDKSGLILMLEQCLSVFFIPVA